MGFDDHNHRGVPWPSVQPPATVRKFEENVLMETTKLTGFMETDPEERWQQQYRDLELMQHTLVFFAEELVFLRNLIDRHLMWLMEEEGLTNLQSVTNRIASAATGCEGLRHTVSGLISRTGSLIENPFAQDEHRLRQDFIRLKDNLSEYTDNLRSVKKEVFKAMEEAIRTEKARRLLSQSGSEKS